jgi:hypothetical protein
MSPERKELRAALGSKRKVESYLLIWFTLRKIGANPDQVKCVIFCLFPELKPRWKTLSRSVQTIGG